MSVLVTGAAGFIGYHLAASLLDRGEEVIGVDDLNSYYDVGLKQARLARLQARRGFHFHRLDVADREGVGALPDVHDAITGVIHLAAQAGVRHSLVDPYAYTRSNVEGQLVILDLCRRLAPGVHLVYASSSSVYGANPELPFSVASRTDRPASIYGASKKAGELMAHAYSHLFRIPATGLRFFTVYGPWGRPDMAYSIFTRAILEGRPLKVFNEGDMKRDFTYIDDIVEGVLAILGGPPADTGEEAPHRLYNIGNNRPEPLMRFISILEEAIGKTAEIEFKPMQPGDVKETFADIEAIRRDFGFSPSTSIDEGLPRFVEWFRAYHGI